MKQLFVAAFAALSLAGCVDNTSYTDLTTSTHDCGRASNIAIKASGGEFALTGTCEKIRIAGNGNTITIEAAASVSVSGDGNKVVIRSVDDVGVRGGSGNTVTYQRGLRKIAPNVHVVGGNDNNVGDIVVGPGGVSFGNPNVSPAKTDKAAPKS